MSKTLQLALRPKTFSALYGQDKITKAIEKQFASKRIPRSWMFSGQTGSGKTTIARILALGFQCKHQNGTIGNPCLDCRKRFYDFSIQDINASSKNGVQEISELVQGAEFAPLAPSRRRVYILDEAHRLS